MEGIFMTVFADYALFYDDLYQDKSYATEAAWVASKIREVHPEAHTLLDVGCGTGKHARELASLGFEVTGIDRSPQMIGHAVATSNSSISFAVGDLVTLDLDRKFDVVTSLFHVVSYQTTNVALAKSVDNLLRHAHDGGVVIFDFWHGPGVLSDPPAVRVKRVVGKEHDIVRVAEPSHDFDRSLVDVDYIVYATRRSDGSSLVATETHRMRYLFQSELRFLFDSFGVTDVAFSAWLADNAPGSAWEACAIARKPG
jgi:SAM-dependent methyltransferase